MPTWRFRWIVLDSLPDRGYHQGMWLDGVARLRRLTLPATFSLTVFALVFAGIHSPARKGMALPPSSSLSPPHALPLAGVTVVLDPGHGGADSGAVRHGDAEAALTYRTAAELAACVRRVGGRVVYTVRSRDLDPQLAVTEPVPTLPRDAVLASTGQPLRLRRGDTPRPLWQRAAVARRLQQSCSAPAARDLFFLSLHYDDYPSAEVHGSLVCVDRRMGVVPLFARNLAISLCAAGLARHDRYHGLRGISARHLGVLDPLYNPVRERLLLELATISNPADAADAAAPTWRRAMADRITAALIATHDSALP